MQNAILSDIDETTSLIDENDDNDEELIALPITNGDHEDSIDQLLVSELEEYCLTPKNAQEDEVQWGNLLSPEISYTGSEEERKLGSRNNRNAAKERVDYVR